MHYLYKLIVAIVLCAPQFTEGQTVSFQELKRLNDQEKRLQEFKDSDEILQIKLQHLEIINKSRQKHNVPPVLFDILASRIGNKIATKAAKKEFMGHFNTQGESPYIRYALAGGTDHIKENAASITANQKLPTDAENLLEYMKANHEAFMSERKPNDGHKQNCIDPHHTHVGIGIAWHDNEFRYYEEFIDRYLNITIEKQDVNINQLVNITFKPLTKDLPYTILVYHEPFPKPMSVSKINRTYSYDDFGKTEFLSLPPWDIPRQDPNGWYQLSFTPVKRGYYYVQIFLSPKPYETGPATTKGKIQASGIVIKAY